MAVPEPGKEKMALIPPNVCLLFTVCFTLLNKLSDPGDRNAMEIQKLAVVMWGIIYSKDIA